MIVEEEKVDDINDGNMHYYGEDDDLQKKSENFLEQE